MWQTSIAFSSRIEEEFYYSSLSQHSTSFYSLSTVLHARLEIDSLCSIIIYSKLCHTLAFNWRVTKPHNALVVCYGSWHLPSPIGVAALPMHFLHLHNAQLLISCLYIAYSGMWSGLGFVLVLLLLRLPSEANTGTYAYVYNMYICVQTVQSIAYLYYKTG